MSTSTNNSSQSSPDNNSSQSSSANGFWDALKGLAITAVGDYIADKTKSKAMEESRNRWWDTTQRLADDAMRRAGSLNTSQMWSAAGQTGVNVPTMYERGLSRVAPTTDAIAAATGTTNLAGQMLTAPIASSQAARAAADITARGAIRQAQQMGRNIDSASAMRDIIGASSQHALGASQNIAGTSAQAYSHMLPSAANAIGSIPQTLQQSQLAQYALWARPHEAQLSPTANQLMMREAPYEIREPQFDALAKAIMRIGGASIGASNIGLPPTRPGELASFVNYEKYR